MPIPGYFPLMYRFYSFTGTILRRFGRTGGGLPKLNRPEPQSRSVGREQPFKTNGTTKLPCTRSAVLRSLHRSRTPLSFIKGQNLLHAVSTLTYAAGQLTDFSDVVLLEP